MSEIALEQFVNKHDVRYYLHEPFNFGGRKIYTDGHTMAYCHTDEPDTAPENLRANLADILRTIESNSTWQEFEIEESAKEQCSDCLGSGKSRLVECNDCDGHGEVHYSVGSHDYSDDCKNCLGAGEFVVPGGDDNCLKCDGKGEAFIAERMAVFQSEYNPKYLERINKPGTETNLPGPESMLIFRNGEIKGAIMYMRSGACNFR